MSYLLGLKTDSDLSEAALSLLRNNSDAII